MSKFRQGHHQGNHSGCPDRKLLTAMLRGELPPNVTDELAIHIDRCPACIQTLELIDDTSDSLAHKLKNATPADFSIVHQELLEQESYGATTMFGLMGTAKGIQARLNPPCDFGQYYIEKHAGRGGMGDVYLGFQKTLKRPTAIKLLRPNRSNSNTAAARFKEEMRVVAMLDHPNLVKAYDGGEYEGRLYLAMELLDGETLADYVKRKGPFAPQRACQICMKAARGLQHAHEANIYHRDIKPGNIMFTRDGKIKVLDLGLAFAPQDLISAGERESVSLAGTPEYMAPEQSRDPKSVDARSDIYSLGCTLYFLLTGAPPFPRNRFPSVASLMNAHQKEPVPDVRMLRGDVSDELAETLNRMLCKDPLGRPQSAIEVCKLLEATNQTGPADFNFSVDDVLPRQQALLRSKRNLFRISSAVMVVSFILLTIYGSALMLRINNQGIIELRGDTRDISIEARASNGDRFTFKVTPGNRLTLRADDYELQVVGKELFEVAPSRIRVPRGSTVPVTVRAVDSEQKAVRDHSGTVAPHAKLQNKGQHWGNAGNVGNALPDVSATHALADASSKQPSIDETPHGIALEERDTGVGDLNFWVAPGFILESWASDLGDIRSIAVGGEDFGGDPFVYSMTRQEVLRVTAKNTVQPFAKGFQQDRNGRIVFQRPGAEIEFGEDMFVSAPANDSEAADLIYRVQPNGTVSIFHSGPRALAKGAAFGAGSGFRGFLYVINLETRSLWRVDPNGQGTSYASGVTSSSWEDDMIFTTGGEFGEFAYLTDRARGKVLRVSSGGQVTEFSNVPGATSIVEGVAAFGRALFVGTVNGTVFRVGSTGDAVPILTGYRSHSQTVQFRGIAVADGKMWLTSDSGELLRITLSPPEYPMIAGTWMEAPGILFSILQDGPKFTATTTYQHESAGQIRAVVTGTITKEGKIVADFEHIRAPSNWAKHQNREAVLSQDGKSIRGRAVFKGGEHDFVWTLQP